jgi:putative membrane protein
MLLDETARNRIASAIAEVEKTTQAEIVVLEIAQAEPYRDLRLLYAACFGLAAAVAMHALAPELATHVLLWLELLLAAGAYALLAVDPVLRPLLPKARKEQAVAERAQLELIEQGVLSTQSRTGVLILLSDLERGVVILGDRGIHQRVGPGWPAHVARIVDAIHAGRAADGVCAVVQELGRTLAAQLPPLADNPDELPNAVPPRS